MSVWVTASSVVSPLGVTSEENFAGVRIKKSGLAKIHENKISEKAIVAGWINGLHETPEMTRFEAMCRKATDVVLVNNAFNPKRTLYILSTTKGNISLLGSDSKQNARLSLHATAQYLASQAGLTNSLVVSNACISGVLSVIVAKRFIEAGKYDHVVVVGADEVSKFVVSGFESLHALSDTYCQPFDAARKGINLGEAAAVLVISNSPGNAPPLAKISGGGVSNDANHISGPSRTGNELALAIQQAINESGTTIHNIGSISAHGTGTVFNDEMEAKAFSQLGMNGIPLYSLKGYFGHTLGAAGVVETAMCIQGMLRDEIPASLGFGSLGVSEALNVTKALIKKETKICLKTASGFGGCNAAIIIEKGI